MSDRVAGWHERKKSNAANNRHIFFGPTISAHHLSTTNHSHSKRTTRSPVTLEINHPHPYANNREASDDFQRIARRDLLTRPTTTTLINDTQHYHCWMHTHTHTHIPTTDGTWKKKSRPDSHRCVTHGQPSSSSSSFVRKIFCHLNHSCAQKTIHTADRSAWRWFKRAQVYNIFTTEKSLRLICERCAATPPHTPNVTGK